MFGLEEFMVSGFFKLCLGVTGIVMARLTLLWMDKTIHKSHSKFAVFIEETADPLTKGIYYGARFIAIAIIIGSALS